MADEDNVQACSIRTSIPVPLTETQQRELWSKYSALVPYVPPYLPDAFCAAASAELRLSIDDAVVSDEQSSSPQESARPSATLQMLSVRPWLFDPYAVAHHFVY